MLLAADQLLCHPLIVLELACGTPPGPRERLHFQSRARILLAMTAIVNIMTVWQTLPTRYSVRRSIASSRAALPNFEKRKIFRLTHLLLEAA